MKKLFTLLFLATSMICFGQNKNFLKEAESLNFYGVDYSAAKVFGAAETPAEFKVAFGLVIIAKLLNKAEAYGSYQVVFFNTDTKEIIQDWATGGKARGFGLRNYWAGSIYKVINNL